MTAVLGRHEIQHIHINTTFSTYNFLDIYIDVPLNTILLYSGLLGYTILLYVRFYSFSVSIPHLPYYKRLHTVFMCTSKELKNA